MRVLLTGGGTGGHVYPALAIAEIIKKNEKDAEIAFVGTEKGIENRLVRNEGYEIYHVPIQGIERSLSPKNIKTAALILTSPNKAKKIIEEFQPDVVIGTGGYVCWPLLEAATKMGVPAVVHESNAAAGLAVKALQRKLDVILTNFKETEDGLRTKRRIVNVGNPLRMSYSEIEKRSAREKLGIDKNKFVVLSFGGSIGATGVNHAAIEIMKEFSTRTDGVLHIHASGARFYERFKGRVKELGLDENENVKVYDYIYDMPQYMAAADVVVCRAGAVTLSELAMLGKPAVLMPSPYVTDDHQYKNAKVLADRGGAVLVREPKDMPEGAECCKEAARAVKGLCESKEKREKMSEAVRTLAREDTERLIFEEIERLVKKKG